MGDSSEPVMRRMPAEGGPRGGSPDRIRRSGYTFDVFPPLHEGFAVERLREVDAVIFDCRDAPPPLDFIRTVRAHTDQAIYLKPLFLLRAQKKAVDAVTKALTDGRVYDLERLETAVHTTEAIARKDDEFTKSHSVSLEDQVLTKLLRYVVSRDEDTIAPIPARNAKMGYAYPLLDVNYKFANEHKSLGALAVAEEEGLLLGEFVDAWYVCSNCSESKIHLREVCPKCGTSDVNEEELVHHFRCAYVGPLSDFTAELNVDELVCPKCERQLEHVGVDYDKPSNIFTCKNNHTFQDAPVEARCFTCGTETRVEYLTKQVFKQYELTPKGREKSRTGVTANVQQLVEIEGTVPYDAFETMLRYEIERGKATSQRSALGIIHFTNAHELFSFIDRSARISLLAELADDARRLLSDSDVIAFKNLSTMICLIPSLNAEQATDRLRQIGDDWKQQVADRYEGYETQLVCAARPLSEAPAETQIDDLPTESVEHA